MTKRDKEHFISIAPFPGKNKKLSLDYFFFRNRGSANIFSLKFHFVALPFFGFAGGIYMIIGLIPFRVLVDAVYMIIGLIPFHFIGDAAYFFMGLIPCIYVKRLDWWNPFLYLHITTGFQKRKMG